VDKVFSKCCEGRLGSG